MKRLFKKLIYFTVRSARTAKRRFILQSAVSSGMKVGAGTQFVGTQSFGSEPYLIEIGDNCRITDAVSFICHDGAWCVACGVNGIPLPESAGRYSIFGRISIGDNCFIGVSAILLPNTSLGKNCIVGAGAVVRGQFPDGSVIAGNPGKVVGGIEDYMRRNAPKAVEISKEKSSHERKNSVLSAVSTHN